MPQQAIGLLETRGLAALVAGTDAMLKSANVTLAGEVISVQVIPRPHEEVASILPRLGKSK